MNRTSSFRRWGDWNPLPLGYDSSPLNTTPRLVKYTLVLIDELNISNSNSTFTFNAFI